MKVTPEQIEAVLALPADQRLKHFIKVVVDCQRVTTSVNELMLGPEAELQKY